MEEMELEIQDLTEKTQILENKCQSLQTINDSLMEKNQKLDLEVEQLRQELHEIVKRQQNQLLVSQIASSDGCGSLNRSAVSDTDPLQQGSHHKDTQSSQEAVNQDKLLNKLKRSQTQTSLLRVIGLCLLYKICSSTKSSMTELSIMQTLMPASWRKLPKACLPISQQTWKQAIEHAVRLLPKLQAAQSDCLDQWWGPQQNAWNPADIKASKSQATVAATLIFYQPHIRCKCF